MSLESVTVIGGVYSALNAALMVVTSTQPGIRDSNEIRHEPRIRFRTTDSASEAQTSGPGRAARDIFLSS